ncbi:MAG: hypothetical protein M3Q44_01250 [bacterium]|nr:hypothetical protein [bacterium]
MFKPFLRPSIILVFIFSIFTYICVSSTIGTSNSDDVIAFFPLFPWILISYAFEQAFFFFFLGYLIFYTLNAVLIFHFVNKYIHVNDSFIPRVRNPLYLAIVLTGGYLLWAIPVINYAIHCTEKMCGLVGALATFPTNLIFSFADTVVDESVWMYASVVINALILFWIGWHVEKRALKNYESRNQ